MADDDADTDGAPDAEPEAAEPAPEPEPESRTELQPTSPVRLATIVGLVLLVALAGLVGWLGYRTYQFERDAELRSQFLEAGRHGAFSLTNVNWEQADADVQRILDAATGSFYDDMQRRAASYVEIVKQAKSKSVGTVTEAGLASSSDNGAEVLVSVTVDSSNAGAPEQPPRAWRMRLEVEKVGDEAKVSTVDFVS